MARKPGLTLAGLHLFTLSSYAVAQPLLDLISKNLQFLVAHKLTPVEIVLLLGFLILVVPLPFLLLSLTGQLVDRRSSYRWLQGLAVCLLTSAFLLQASKRIWEGPGALLIVVAVMASLIFSISYVRLPLIRQFVTWLTPGLLLFPVWFLFRSSALEVATADGTLTVPSLESHSTTPILMVVFDQLPLVSLLDEEGQIDPVRYPSFSELARDSVWYRNATAVSDRTGWALPALLTGNYPDPEKLPVYEHHPNNLLTLFSQSHQVYTFEPITSLCPAELCSRLDQLRGSRATLLLTDLGILYLHLLLPAKMAESLPPADQSWKDLAEGASKAWKDQWIEWRDRDRLQSALSAIDSIQPEGDRPPIYFLHILLPHEPYLYLPSGKQYAALPHLGGLLAGEKWSSKEASVKLAYQRHLLQVGTVDRLLGRFLEQTRAAKLYDRSLIVVTSDHGASFRPGDSFKHPTDTNFPDILPVPLLVKPPAGSFAPGVRDRHLETIDILPTLAQYVGGRLPVAIDGTSALETQNPERTRKTIFFAGALRRDSYPVQQVTEGTHQSAARKVDLFGSRDQGLLATSAAGFEMIGLRPEEIGVAGRSTDAAWLDLPALYDRVDPASDFVPAQVTGYLQSNPERRRTEGLALAINGIIRATTRLELEPSENTSLWSVIVSEDSFHSGRNLIEVFTIDSIQGSPSLRLAYRSQGSPSPPNFGVKTTASVWGLKDSGFYDQERWLGRLVRWTDGKASVTVSRKRLGFAPASVKIRLARGGPRGSRLTVLSCGRPIHEEQIGPGVWTKSLGLLHCSPQADEVQISLLSETFVPHEVLPDSRDTRQLGVAVESIVFLPE